MTSSLTREQLLGLPKTRREKVAIDGLGDVWLRSLSHFQRSQRMSSFFDGRGNPIPEKQDRQSHYRIVDQVTDEEGNPLFTDADVEAMGEIEAGGALDDLLAAITAFNVAGEPKKNGQPSDS